MDNTTILSLSASHSLSTTTFFLHHRTTTATSSAAVSFSLKRPPPPQQEPSEPSGLGRANKFLTPTPPHQPPKPTPSFNPLKNLTNPFSTPPSRTETPNASDSLAFKLRLTSKLSPPLETHLQPDQTREPVNLKPEIRSPEPDFRQEGKIFIGNLPTWVKKHEVADFFRQFGPIQNVILIKGHNETVKNAGFGFVIYGGETAASSAAKAVEFDGVEFHGRVLTVKLDDGNRLRLKAEERKRWVEGEVEQEEESYRSPWHQEREGARRSFRKVLETKPENWQAVVSAFERINKVCS